MQGTRSCTRPRMAQGGTRMAMRMATRMDAGMDAGMDALTVRTGNRACPGRAHEQDRTDQRARETGVRNDKCPRKRHCPQDRLARQGRTTRERTTRQENRPEGPAPNSPGGSAPSFEGQQALSPDIFCLAPFAWQRKTRGWQRASTRTERKAVCPARNKENKETMRASLSASLRSEQAGKEQAGHTQHRRNTIKP